MTVREGKDFLCDRLQKCNCTTDIDELLVYKYGNIKEAKNYQHDKIPGTIDFSKECPNVRYVVKCFIHLGVYAAWRQEVCRGSGMCIAYKKDLVAFDQNKECTYAETTLDKDAITYWFRGEEGVDHFLTSKLLKASEVCM